MRSLVFFVMLCCSVAQLHARDWYVDNRLGDDQFSGRLRLPASGDGPVRTIAKALRVCGAADRIVIANTGMAYRESFTLVGGRHSGLPDFPFVVEGNGAMLDGRTLVPAEAWSVFRGDVYRFRPPRQASAMLYLGERPARFHPPLERQNGAPRLEPLEWSLVDGYIWFRVEQGKLIEDYPLSIAALAVGVGLYHVHDVVVSNLVVQGYQLDGVNAHDGVSMCRLSNVTSRGNGRSGFTVANASRVLLDGCVSGDNGASQLRSEGYSHTRLINTSLLANTAPRIVSSGGEAQIEGDSAAPR